MSPVSNQYRQEGKFKSLSEQAQSDSETRFRIAVENSGMVVFEQDLGLRYTWVHNPHPPFTEEVMIGKTDEELLLAEDAARLTSIKREVLAKGEKGRATVQTTIDGYRYSYDLTVEPVYDDDQQIVGILGSYVDVTYRKQIEDTLRQINEELEQHVQERTFELKQEIAERKQIEAELAEMQRRLMDSVETERTLLARELHDGPMQDIYAIIYRLAMLRNYPSVSDILEELEKIQDRLKEINSNLRSTARSLRPSTIGDFGLEKSIREYLSNSPVKQHNLEVHLDLMPDRQSIPETVRLALFRIYQTAFTNVIRHAQATEVEIRLRLENEFIVLEVEDNGKGFSLPERWLEFAREGHLGLLGAFERAQAIGGVFKVQSQIGEGTLVRVVVPR